MNATSISRSLLLLVLGLTIAALPSCASPEDEFRKLTRVSFQEMKKQAEEDWEETATARVGLVIKGSYRGDPLKPELKSFSRRTILSLAQKNEVTWTIVSDAKLKTLCEEAGLSGPRELYGPAARNRLRSHMEQHVGNSADLISHILMAEYVLYQINANQDEALVTLSLESINPNIAHSFRGSRSRKIYGMEGFVNGLVSWFGD